MGKKYMIEVEDRPFQDVCGTELWKIENLNCYITKSELEKLEEYKEPEKRTLTDGDVCYIPGQYDDDKLLVLSIGTGITVFLQSNGEVWTMMNTSFKEKAVYLYHSHTFDKFLKGGFHELDRSV